MGNEASQTVDSGELLETIGTMPRIPRQETSWITAIAVADSKGDLPGDLAFKRGDRLLVENNGNQVVFGQNVASGEQGFIARNCFKLEDCELDNKPWYFPNSSRLQAERMMLPPGVPAGSHIVRRAADGNLALSLKTNAPDVKHYKIHRFEHQNEPYLYYISDKKMFPSLDELISFYKDQSAELGCQLTVPCPCTRRVTMFPELEIPRKSIRLLQLLGSGNFGEVQLGKWKSLDVAVKTVKTDASTEQELLNEARRMWRVQQDYAHPKLITLYAICVDGPLWMVSEYMNRGSLRLWLLRDKGKELKFTLLIDFLEQICDGMRFLEQQHMIHRDLRADNILANDQLEVKIGDFGLARDNEYKFSQNCNYPVRWTAPEAIRKNQFSNKSDVWSFGVLTYEILTYGFLPYAGMDADKIQSYIESGNRLQRPPDSDKYYPQKIHRVQLECWHADPAKRPTFQSLNEKLRRFKDDSLYVKV